MSTALGSDGGRLVSFTCPRCGYLPDRFFSRRISAQLRLNRAILAAVVVIQLLGFAFIQLHMNQADAMRREVIQRLDKGCRP